MVYSALPIPLAGGRSAMLGAGGSTFVPHHGGSFPHFIGPVAHYPLHPPDSPSWSGLNFGDSLPQSPGGGSGGYTESLAQAFSSLANSSSQPKRHAPPVAQPVRRKSIFKRTFQINLGKTEAAPAPQEHDLPFAPRTNQPPPSFDRRQHGAWPADGRTKPKPETHGEGAFGNHTNYQMPSPSHKQETIAKLWRPGPLAPISPEDFEVVSSLGEGSSGKVLCVRMRDRSASGGARSTLIACKTFREEAISSGAVEIAAWKALQKLSSNLGEGDEAARWAAEHTVQLIGFSIGWRDTQLHSEFCEGGEILDFLDRHLEAAYLRVYFVIDLMKAVHACHAAGILHLDIKVENCFIAKNSKRQPVLKLGDFGGAMSWPQIGSPKACSFPPPEVTLSQHQAPLSPSWDVWSMAICIANILGVDRDISLDYQAVTNKRCQHKVYPIHTISSICRLRNGILNASNWHNEPQPELLGWFEDAMAYDEAQGPRQTRPSARRLLESFPAQPMDRQ